MSHLKERTEKNCLNCNAEVTGKFCSVCGQENIEPAESAWHLITHFFNDITHFDGKFFSSLKYLIFKPGFLSSEYKIGRRASYLNPVRMYVFTSAIFFLIFFSLFHFDKISSGTKKFQGKTIEAIDKMDSTAFYDFTRQINKGRPMSRQKFRDYFDSSLNKRAFQFAEEYSSRAEYDSLLKSGKKKDGWFKKMIIYKQIEVNSKDKNDPDKSLNDLITIFMHNIPQMLFISLPLFALFLKFIYIRNKIFYYASHSIFSIHLYILIFIVLLGIIFLNKLSDSYHWKGFTFMSGLLYFFIFFYEYKAMRNFYGQRRAKTIIKFLLLNSWLIFILVLLLIIFLFFSFLKV